MNGIVPIVIVIGGHPVPAAVMGLIALWVQRNPVSAPATTIPSPVWPSAHT